MLLTGLINEDVEGFWEESELAHGVPLGAVAKVRQCELKAAGLLHGYPEVTCEI
jgi:hypothetical protein